MDIGKQKGNEDRGKLVNGGENGGIDFDSIGNTRRWDLDSTIFLHGARVEW